MFFIAAKLSWFLLQPLNLALLVWLFTSFAALRGGARRSGGLSLIACALLAVLSWTNVGALMMQPLERAFARPALPADVAGIVMLGGGFEGIVNRARGGHELNAAGDRVVETVALALKFPRARVVISGGSGSLAADDATDAETAPGLLRALGIDPARIQVEGRSRDTYENALFSRDLVRPQAGAKWLLVTSAFHMPRAMALFDKAGFKVIAWPTDFRTTGRERFAVWRDQSVDSLHTATIALREWIGLAAYRLSGRTDRLLPDPVSEQGG